MCPPMGQGTPIISKYKYNVVLNCTVFSDTAERMNYVNRKLSRKKGLCLEEEGSTNTS